MAPTMNEEDENDPSNVPCDGTHPLPRCLSWECWHLDAETLNVRRTFRRGIEIAFLISEAKADYVQPSEELTALSAAFKMAFGMVKEAWEARDRKRCGWCISAADGDAQAVEVFESEAALRAHVVLCDHNPPVKRMRQLASELEAARATIGELRGQGDVALRDALAKSRQTSNTRQAVIDEATAVLDAAGRPAGMPLAQRIGALARIAADAVSAADEATRAASFFRSVALSGENAETERAYGVLDAMHKAREKLAVSRGAVT